jgi:hypothetical protein
MVAMGEGDKFETFKIHIKCLIVSKASSSLSSQKLSIVSHY